MCSLSPIAVFSLCVVDLYSLFMLQSRMISPRISSAVLHQSHMAHFPLKYLYWCFSEGVTPVGDWSKVDLFGWSFTELSLEHCIIMLDLPLLMFLKALHQPNSLVNKCCRCLAQESGIAQNNFFCILKGDQGFLIPQRNNILLPWIDE